jgi:SAM-dependent methyltransferase
MTDAAKVYTPAFFNQISGASSSSASVAVPLILSLFRDVSSVADVGCGAGAWLEAFLKAGIPTVRGFDGGGVELSQLRIPESCFVRTDLANPPTIDERFDLAVSLEVAEHLPESSAQNFIRFLTGLADRIVFSAALPGQGGKDHINEQHISYWRKQFEAFGYSLYDVIRPKLWHDDRVMSFYRQNMIVAVKDGCAPSHWRAVTDADLVDVVHPEYLLHFRRKAARKREFYRQFMPWHWWSK